MAFFRKLGEESGWGCKYLAHREEERIIKFIYYTCHRDSCLLWTMSDWHIRARPKVEGKEIKQVKQRTSLQFTEK